MVGRYIGYSAVREYFLGNPPRQSFLICFCRQTGIVAQGKDKIAHVLWDGIQG